MKGKDQEPVALEKKKVFENESSDEEEQDGKIVCLNLSLSILGKISADDALKYFSYLSKPAFLEN